jgi:hypothetical protein
MTHPDQGIQTMFQISAANHQPLSEMADKKAHIMITANSIILTAVISLLLQKIRQEHLLAIPIFILISISLAAMIFAIMATRPTIGKKRYSITDLKTKKINLLFFGNFYRMDPGEYKEGMMQMIKDADWLFNSLIVDSYIQGVVLGRKYRWLRRSYSTFMFGLIAAVIAFLLAAAFGKNHG